jgi:hypothetical protein
MHPAALPRGAGHHRFDRRFQAEVMIEITSWTTQRPRARNERRNAVQNARDNRAKCPQVRRIVPTQDRDRVLLHPEVEMRE